VQAADKLGFDNCNVVMTYPGFNVGDKEILPRLGQLIVELEADVVSPIRCETMANGAVRCSRNKVVGIVASLLRLI
jgi:hypothetical protein